MGQRDHYSPICYNWAKIEEDDDTCLYGELCCMGPDDHDVAECHTHLTPDYVRILRVQEGH